MFKLLDFEILQTRYIKAAMNQIPSFQPDGKVVADVQTMVDDAGSVKTTYFATDQALGLARGELDEASDILHSACVQVYAIMKSRFRADPGSLQAINRLPVHDRTTRDTLERSTAISTLWGQLPNPPGSAEPFKAWDTMDKTAFDAVLATADTQNQDFADVEQEFQLAEGRLHETLDTLEDFTTAALVTGRNQFEEETAEREVIDAVPTEPAQQDPAQVVIAVAESPAAGEVHLEYSAAHATSYDVLERLAGETEFALVAADVIETTYDATGLANGTYEYQVIGRNSRGDGPASEVASIIVGVGTTFDFDRESDGEGGEFVWFMQPEGVSGVTEIFLREGAVTHTEAVSLQPGQSQQVHWTPITITGEIDEIVLRDAQGNVLATGVRNTGLPNPGP